MRERQKIWSFISTNLAQINLVDVFFEGNSAGQAIELLIQKGVPESHIIFLNLISVSPSPPNCWCLLNLLKVPIDTYADPTLLMLNLGPWGNPLCLQTVPIPENCDLRDWCCIEWRVQGDTRHGRVWRQILWHRWWLMILWYEFQRNVIVWIVSTISYWMGGTCFTEWSVLP